MFQFSTINIKNLKHTQTRLKPSLPSHFEIPQENMMTLGKRIADISNSKKKITIKNVKF